VRPLVTKEARLGLEILAAQPGNPPVVIPDSGGASGDEAVETRLSAFQTRNLTDK